MVSEDLRISVNQALDALPESATIEDLMERLYLLAKVQRGLDDVDAGRLLSHDDVKSQFLR